MQRQGTFRGLSDEDDTQGKPLMLMRPADNVYSYFIFVGPTEKKRRAVRTPHREKEVSWDVVMGYILLALNFFMQGVLLYLIFQEVVVENINWQNGVIKIGNGGNPVALIGEQPENGCNDGNSLCFQDKKSGKYSCAPPTLQLTGRWDELDTDGDGIWTRAEVEAEKEDLKCKYFVDPIEVFDVLIKMLKERESILWLHPDVKAGSAIHLPYFTYVMSDLIMCGYRSEDMCANLLERGFFHAPMKYNTSPRVGNTIDSALQYCKELLAPGGICARNLPSTYAVWQIASGAECGEPEHSQFQYTNPGSGETKSLVNVDYSSRLEYVLAQDLMFRLFKAIMIFAWLLLMMWDFRDVIKVLTFCARMPDAEVFQSEDPDSHPVIPGRGGSEPYQSSEPVIMEQDPSDPEDVRYRIQAIYKHHRYGIVLCCLVRSILTLILAVVGVAYLIKTNDYADLIMNGVALVFIAEISSVLYSQVLREEIKDQTEDIKPIKIEMYGWDWLNDRPALIDILCVVIVWILVYFIMRWQMNSVVVPVHEALECSCIVQGDHCVEAMKYDFDFWHEYWMKGIPAALSSVDRLKSHSDDIAASPAAALSLISLTANFTVAQERFNAEVTALTNRIQQLEQEVPHKLASREHHINRPSPIDTTSQHKTKPGRAGGHESLAPEKRS